MTTRPSMRGLTISADRQLQYSDHLTAPIAQPGQVLIEVQASGLNPSDADIASGSLDSFFDATSLAQPVRTGLECAGVVLDTGSDSSLSVGQQVYGYPDVFGPVKTHQSVIALDPDWIAPMPTSTSVAQAASLPLAAMTSLATWRDVAQAKPGERVLIIGAAGGVGAVSVQMAKRAFDLDVTGLASATNRTAVLGMGADRVVDYHQTPLSDLSERYDVIVDWTTRYRFADIAHLLSEQGRFVPADPFQNQADFEPGTVAAEQTRYLLAAKGTRADLTTIAEWVDEGLLEPAVDSEYALTDVAAAMARLHQRHKQGRVVFII